MQINLDSSRGIIGFGDYLCMISLFCDVPTPVELYCDNKANHYNSLLELTRILNVSKDKLKIIYRENHTGDFSGGCYLKLLSNYYTPEYVNINGQLIEVNDKSQSKPYIGLACYSGLYDPHDVYFNDNNDRNLKDRMPGCRYRSVDYYSKIFSLIKNHGYDVVTLDSAENLELKILQLLKTCSAVIGYEGGIAHLCHMLQIPFIMLDWRPNNDSQYGEFQVEVLQQSNTVHIIKDDTMFLNIGKNEFKNLINDLKYAHSTNNRLVTGEYRMQYVDGFNGKVDFVNANNQIEFSSTVRPRVSPSAAKFVETFYKDKFPNL